ncbi:hypothetical protein SAMIE_1013700 [Sphingobium amiense]|uniref:DUF4402 domain-containing protein n=1 Tax=Sphingobium amiense TaxID=135719 RepID=A0A494WC55_9SPHN|nr:hypothetical protein [Sphingobium amiense]BBD97869.1 hypothetical protein SAMIE_1013700 [Sphingobium amiense]
MKMMIAISLMIGGAAAHANTVTPAPPMQTIAVPRAAPPPVFNPVPVGRAAMPVTRVTVRVLLGRETLWSGPLSIGASTARISLNEPVSGAEPCEQGARMAAMRQIEVMISGQPYSGAAAPYRLTARYTRPVDLGGCNGGTRGISIEQGFSLSGANPFVAEGDGGFRVEITAP